MAMVLVFVTAVVFLLFRHFNSRLNQTCSALNNNAATTCIAVYHVILTHQMATHAVFSHAIK